MKVTKEIVRCDVTGGTRGVKRCAITVGEIDSAHPENSKVVLDADRDLSPRALQRVVNAIERVIGQQPEDTFDGHRRIPEVE